MWFWFQYFAVGIEQREDIFKNKYTPVLCMTSKVKKLKPRERGTRARSPELVFTCLRYNQGAILMKNLRVQNDRNPLRKLF